MARDISFSIFARKETSYLVPMAASADLSFLPSPGFERLSRAERAGPPPSLRDSDFFVPSTPAETRVKVGGGGSSLEIGSPILSGFLPSAPSGRKFLTLGEAVDDGRKVYFTRMVLINPTQLSWRGRFGPPGKGIRDVLLPPRSKTEVRDVPPNSSIWVTDPTDASFTPLTDAVPMTAPSMVVGGIGYDGLPVFPGLKMGDEPLTAVAGVWIDNRFAFPIEVSIEGRSRRKHPLITATPGRMIRSGLFLEGRVNYGASVSDYVTVDDTDTTFTPTIAARIAPRQRVWFTDEGNGLAIGQRLLFSRRTARGSLPLLDTLVSSPWQQSMVLGVSFSSTGPSSARWE